MTSAPATLQRLIDVVLADTRLSPWAGELITLDVTAPDATTHLRAFYDRHIDEVRSDGVAPTEDLAKCVPVDRFLMYYADPDTRDEYAFGRTRDAYATDVAAEPDPSARLTADLPADPGKRLIDALYSWVAPSALLDGLSADQIVATLRIRAASPLVALDLPISHTVPAKVEVRPPCAIDTIPAMDDVWEPGAVPGELVDNDIPRAACAGARWIP